MLANTTVNLSQHKPSGAIALQRMYRWDSQKVLTSPSFLQLQMCFGRLRSSRRSGKRATIQHLFSKHQHLKRLRRKRPFHFRVCVFSLCSWQFSELVQFLLQLLPGTLPASFKCYQSTKHLHSTLFSPKWFRKIIFVPPLKWYCNFLLEILSQGGIKGSKDRKGLCFFSVFPSRSRKRERRFYESILQYVKCQYSLTLQAALRANAGSSLVVTLDGPTTEANVVIPGNTCWTEIPFPSSTPCFLPTGRFYFKIKQ